VPKRYQPGVVATNEATSKGKAYSTTRDDQLSHAGGQAAADSRDITTMHRWKPFRSIASISHLLDRRPRRRRLSTHESAMQNFRRHELLQLRTISYADLQSRRTHKRPTYRATRIFPSRVSPRSEYKETCYPRWRNQRVVTSRRWRKQHTMCAKRLGGERARIKEPITRRGIRENGPYGPAIARPPRDSSMIR